jgi:hypothetical protein
MAKHFIISPEKGEFDRASIAESHLAEQFIHQQAGAARKSLNEKIMGRRESLQFIQGRVIVKVDIEKKNNYTFEDGTVIRRERKYNEFNMRVAQPVNATVISAEYIPEGVEILISHNSIHDTNKIFDYPDFSGEVEAADVKYYSLPEDDCFAWRDVDGEMKPLKNYEFALRVFVPYTGMLDGIPPTKIENVLYITTGKLKGKVVGTLKASDYQIIYQEQNGREGNLIRVRHSEDENFDREEIIYIHHEHTEKVQSGELWVGIETTDAKPII